MWNDSKTTCKTKSKTQYSTCVSVRQIKEQHSETKRSMKRRKKIVTDTYSDGLNVKDTQLRVQAFSPSENRTELEWITSNSI